MRSFLRSFHLIESHFSNTKIMRFKSTSGPVSSSERGGILRGGATPTNFLREPTNDIKNSIVPIKCIMSSSQRSKSENCSQRNRLASQNGFPSLLLYSRSLLPELHPSTMLGAGFPIRCFTIKSEAEPSAEPPSSTDTPEIAPRIKFKRLDKTARHIMQILDKEAVEKVRTEREIPDIKPGYIIQLKVEVPENKRRVSLMKGIVIARRNAGLNTTFRLRRLVAGVGIESVFPLYSPNIKEIKVVDKKKVRRAKLYYLRDQMQMNALKKSSHK